ncbi:MAG: CocE/NonD family hydrolase, partial [Solirubrobacterales bacterium]|nr:CocE/NonD family hydrolase [Solirubrobacterales bacterium]
MRRALLTAALLLASCGSAQAAMVTQDLDFIASDGVHLHAALGAEGSIAPRPTIIEFSPYAPGCCAAIAGPAYNYVQVHARGTGDSDGRWSATGPRDQADVAEFLGWACRQPWSNGDLALYGFSASAIVAYNAMDLDLPCLRTAVLMAGTADLYRDLLYVGGIPNFAPGAAVLGQIGALTIGAGAQRMQRNPASGPEVAAGQLQLGADYLSHSTEDAYWQDRTLDPSRLTVPILADTSFYDVESRGPFEAFKLTRHLGSQLMVMGAHDGVPAGSGGQFPRYKRWFDHYLLGAANGIESEPHVQLWLGNGGREEFLAGRVTRLQGDDWPLPGTRWTPLYLDGQALSEQPARAEATRTYPFAPSNPIASDPYTTGVVAGMGGGGHRFDE